MSYRALRWSPAPLPGYDQRHANSPASAVIPVTVLLGKLELTICACHVPPAPTACWAPSHSQSSRENTPVQTHAEC